MTWLPLSTRDRRAVRLGALTILPVLFVVLVARPYVGAVRAASRELASQRALLTRELAALGAARHDAALSRDGWRAIAEQHSRLFDGADLVAASARLAGYVAERAGQTGVVVEESETRPAFDSAGVAAVELAVSGNVPSVVGFLRALEDGPKFVRVDRIALAPPVGMVATRSDRMVTLRLTVVGFWSRTYGSAALGQRPVAIAGRE